MGRGITNAQKLEGSLVIKRNNQILFDSGDFDKNKSGITIRVRGNSSAYTEKKPYYIKLQKKSDLLFRGDNLYADRNWVLIKDSEALTVNNEMSMKPYIGMVVCDLMGVKYVPKGMYVNLIINDEYRGIYFLSENVKRNPNCRVDIDKNSGFIFEYDPYWWNDEVYFDTSITSPSFKYTIKYPEDEELTDTKISYIQNVMQEFENSLYNSSNIDGFDINSAAIWVLTHDILGSTETGGINKYLFKYDSTNDSKIEMGPLWDFDGIMSIKEAFPNIHVLYGSNIYYTEFFKNTDFVNIYLEEWEKNKNSLFERLESIFDQYINSDEAEALNNARVYDSLLWGIEYKTVQDNLTFAKDFFSNRILWLMSAIPDLQIADCINNTNINEYGNYMYDLRGMLISNPSGMFIQRGKIIYKSKHN